MVTTPTTNTRELSPELADEMRKHLPNPDSKFMILADDLPDIEDVRAARSDHRFTCRVFVDGSIMPMYVPAPVMLQIVLQVLDWNHQREVQRRREREMRDTSTTCLTVTYFDARNTPSQEEALRLPTTALKRRPNPPFYDKFRKKGRGGYG